MSNSWLVRVEPYEGEGFSHFLGRFRRENVLSVTQLGKLTGLEETIARWEKLYWNPPPSDRQLDMLSEVMGISRKRLKKLLPQVGEVSMVKPVRLCAACYGERSYHRREWQYRSVWRCERHGVKLLVRCPCCKKDFGLPRDWGTGACQKCGLAFGEMVRAQK
ncbi:MAG: TniQ family protein [Cyanobacteria bacterium P01_G01_bin.4]